MKRVFKMAAKWVLWLFLLGAPLVAWCGQDPLKLGQVTDNELKMMVYDKDTAAAAVVLYDYGESSFQFTKGTQLIFKRTTRIKVLKKAGLEQADIFIPFYQKGMGSSEKISGVKGFTYNLEDGKVSKEKLEDSDIFEEKEAANWYQKKLTMPNVRVGSVIEFSYTIESDFVENLREWEFQKDIPVVWSEYRVEMVPYFEYTHVMHGFHPFHTQDSKSYRKTMAASYKENLLRGSSQAAEQMGALMLRVQQYRWVMKDVPAFMEEPYLASADDYKSKMEFMLTKVQYPGQKPSYMASNWDGFVKEMLKEEQFGGQLARGSFLKNMAEGLHLNNTDSLARVKAVLAYVQRQLKWNGEYRLYSKSIKTAHEKRTGSVADINLLLVALLREVAIDAHPMLISTRQHGRPLTNLPMLSKFNYVIAHVKIGKNSYLLDATEPSVPFGMLPYRCLNGQGWVVSQPSGEWVPLKNQERDVQVVMAQLEVKPTGEMLGTVEETLRGIPALQMRSSIMAKGKENFMKGFSDKGQEWLRQEVEMKNLENLEEPLKTNYKLSKAGELQPLQLMYLSPMLHHATAENPFKVAERNYPIDFATPSDKVYIFNFTLPEGYEIEEMPKEVNLSLADNSVRFSYMAQMMDGKLRVMSRLNINKEVFGPEEYASLRELYNQLVAKHSEKIVLRKKG
ncbi:DUF3857 domain-containing protein [Rufibacter roseus]|uniref:DUF3857 domain-containing protein n=1 Tax=Rufibacter roseus TaxID=1567108 RepID=A0ABW2DK21_9BACT|nr:DUF3857 domain-containing protein [Rufibacter roseus]